MKDYFSWHASNGLPNASRDAVGLLRYEGLLLVNGHFLVHKDPKVLLSRAALQLLRPQHVLMPGVILTQYKTLHLPLLNFMRFLSAQFSSLSRSLWAAAQPTGVTATPPGFVSSVNLLKHHSAPSSRSLTKKLNSTRPSISPWGIPLLTRFQLTLCDSSYPLGLVVQPVFQFNTYFVSLSIRKLWKTVLKALLKPR